MGWRERAAPYGMQQLADRLGVSVDELYAHPEIVAAAVAQMEDPKGANHVAESFMDSVDRFGGGKAGLDKTVAGYDTMTMATPRVIGNLSSGQRNQTIANLNVSRLAPTIQHIEDVQNGSAARVIPEGSTQNFSPAAAAFQPISPGSWQYYSDPSGKRVYAPTWASDAIRSGQYTISPGGEYFVKDNNQQPFKVSWSQPQLPPGPEGTQTAYYQEAPPGTAPTPAPTTVASAAPIPSPPTTPSPGGDTSTPSGGSDAPPAAAPADTSGGGDISPGDTKAFDKQMSDMNQATMQKSQIAAAPGNIPFVQPKQPNLAQIAQLILMGRQLGSGAGSLGDANNQGDLGTSGQGLPLSNIFGAIG